MEHHSDSNLVFTTSGAILGFFAYIVLSLIIIFVFV